jgi:hypothetical protein
MRGMIAEYPIHILVSGIHEIASLAAVDVNVDEPGRDILAARIDPFRRLWKIRSIARPDRDDPSIVSDHDPIPKHARICNYISVEKNNMT